MSDTKEKSGVETNPSDFLGEPAPSPSKLLVGEQIYVSAIDEDKKVDNPVLPLANDVSNNDGANKKLVSKQETTDQHVDEESNDSAAKTQDKPNGTTVQASTNEKKNSDYHKPLEERIHQPNPYDVLLGRGKPFQNHRGNQEMLRVVDSYRSKYHDVERSCKNEIVEEVLRVVKSNGGRFLERIEDFENSYWSEVEHSIAYRKIGHAFRSNARQLSVERRENLGGSSRKRKNLPQGMQPHVVQFFAASAPMGPNFGDYTDAGTMVMPMPFGLPPATPMFGMMGAAAMGGPLSPPYLGGGFVLNGLFPTGSGQLQQLPPTEFQGSLAMRSPPSEDRAGSHPPILAPPENPTPHVAPHDTMQFQHVQQEAEPIDDLPQQQQHGDGNGQPLTSLDVNPRQTTEGLSHP
ncbi:hypothetical protein IV203_016854 [Nitzschia inconspicua]|uniref:DUF6824 domain-containing protein n=1 Tax=Nitzschia inconspicua TaxID=303405 RepID=A0A9K3PKD1_9STRA|nr:hypothetical protein IV203_016854 [Nitzschia inconspicua]